MQIIRFSGRRTTPRDLVRQQKTFVGCRWGNKIILVECLDTRDNNYIIEEEYRVPRSEQLINSRIYPNERPETIRKDRRRFRPQFTKVIDGKTYELWYARKE